MKSLSVRKGHLIPEIKIPSSKSYANRALILGALSPVSVTIKNLPIATDVTILIKCLKEIGLVFTEATDSITFTNSFPECESGGKLLEVGEGGTTARFLAAMLLLGRSRYQLKLGERLKERPWDDFLSLVESLGGKAQLQNDILTLEGPVLFPEELKVDCSKTTQFATAFELLSLNQDFRVVPEKISSSVSYWDMTKNLVSHFRHNSTFEVPLDWSSASYPMAFGALNQEIYFPGLHYDPLQADSKILNILTELGSVKTSDDGIFVKPLERSKNFKIDVSDCLDLVPTLAYLLAHIEGEHQLTGFQNLVHKESDRLSEVLDLLRKFNSVVNQTHDTIFVHGKPDRLEHEVALKLPNDHRMVMAGTLFLLHHAGGSISPDEAVKKSYPGFFSLIANS